MLAGRDTLGPSDSNLVHKLILQYRIGNCFFLELFACIWHFEYILIHLQFFTNTIQNIGFFLVYIVHFKSNISLFFKITSKFSMNWNYKFLQHQIIIMKVSRSHIAWMFSTAKKKSQFFFIILLHDKAIFIRT